MDRLRAEAQYLKAKCDYIQASTELQKLRSDIGRLEALRNTREKQCNEAEEALRKAIEWDVLNPKDSA